MQTAQDLLDAALQAPLPVLSEVESLRESPAWDATLSHEFGLADKDLDLLFRKVLRKRLPPANTWREDVSSLIYSELLDWLQMYAPEHMRHAEKELREIARLLTHQYYETGSLAEDVFEDTLRASIDKLVDGVERLHDVAVPEAERRNLQRELTDEASLVAEEYVGYFEEEVIEALAGAERELDDLSYDLVAEYMDALEEARLEHELEYEELRGPMPEGPRF